MSFSRPRIWAALAAVILAALWAAPEANAQVRSADVRLGVHRAGVRLVIDSSSPVTAEFLAKTPRRIVLHLNGVHPDGALAGAGVGLLRAWRLSANGEFLSLDLARPAQLADQFQIPPGQTGADWRYVVDLKAGLSRAEGEAAALAPKRKVIVIDAGHGGHDPGAQSDGLDEKDVTLAAALELRRLLLATGHYRVVMTRSTDVFVPLEERVKIARRAGADLFIALHADSAGDNDATHGASVYTLSNRGVTRVTEVLSGHEWFGRAAPRSDPAVKGILLDLTQRTTLNRSNVFARILVDRLSETTDVLPNTHRDAGYFVLLAPDVPAVLLEMGFISSPLDQARLTSRAKRDALMETVAEAIDDYFRGNMRLASN